MKLSKHEQRTLAAKAKKNKPTSMRQQILSYPGRVVSLSTAQRRLQKWPKMSLHDACTVEDMSRKSAGRWQ